MQKNATEPNFGLIEKEYPYRYRWLSTIFLLLGMGLGTLGGIWFAASGKGTWGWLLFSLFFFVFFLFFFYVAIINIFGNRKFIITRDSMYLPSIWTKKYTLIPFAEIRWVGLLDVQGNTVLQLLVNDEECSIAPSWLPSIESLTEILRFIHERANLPLDTSSPPS